MVTFPLVLRSCAQNGDHQVCECPHYHEGLNAQTGKVYGVCQ